MISISFREFKELVLLNFAVSVGADTSVNKDPAEAAALVRASHPGSWIYEAVEILAADGLLKGMRLLSGEGSYSLTGKGIERAEEIALAQGTHLHELIQAERGIFSTVDENGQALSSEDGNALVGITSGPVQSHNIIKLDPLSIAFRELDEQMAITIKDLRGNNALIEFNGPEASQRLAELEAGRALIKADQADGGLVLRVLLPSLNWLGKKVADETAKMAIQKLIALVIAMFTTS